MTADQPERVIQGAGEPHARALQAGRRGFESHRLHHVDQGCWSGRCVGRGCPVQSLLQLVRWTDGSRRGLPEQSALHAVGGDALPVGEDVAVAGGHLRTGVAEERSGGGEIDIGKEEGGGR